MRVALALAISAAVGCQLVAGIDSRSLGAIAADAGSDGAGVPSIADAGGTPPSCATPGVGTASCGLARADSCCASDVLPAGSYDRLDDNGPSSATLSAVRLDRYEVTVGRFRPFVAALAAGFRPPSGAGRHSHLRGGAGLASVGASEAGWDAAWTANLSPALGATPSPLACDPMRATWTASAGPDDDRPIVCETWFEAYAFCIWDGGFLPSEAEWAYAAEGGGEIRKYPWSTPPAATDIDCTFAVYEDCAAKPVAVGAEAHGAGKWGHTDLAGNASEWALDVFAPYPKPCVDCANLGAGTARVHRGGSFQSSATGIFSATRASDDAAIRSATDGLRCARAP